MTIAQHDLLAEHYRYRTPYHPRFFQSLIEQLGIDRQSRLLDVCCGCGDLAAGFAKSCGAVHAIDGAAAMLALAPRLDRITYEQVDVNQCAYQAPHPVDHILIGRAVHWLDGPRLAQLIETNLRPGGKVVICNSHLAHDLPWRAALRQVSRQYGKTFQAFDMTGRGKLHAAGFSQEDRVQATFTARASVQALVGHEVSLAYGPALVNITQRPEQFAQDVAAAVQDHVKDGVIDLGVVNWAQIYSQAATP